MTNAIITTKRGTIDATSEGAGTRTSPKYIRVDLKDANGKLRFSQVFTSKAVRMWSYSIITESKQAERRDASVRVQALHGTVATGAMGEGAVFFNFFDRDGNYISDDVLTRDQARAFSLLLDLEA